jgi:hypothetical protein
MYDESRSIYADAGHLVFFAEGIGDAFKDDVLSSGLYLQLAASAQYSRFSEFEGWRSLYVDAMPRFGWVSTKTYRHAGVSETSFTLWDQITSRLGGRVTDDFLDKTYRFLVDQAADEKINAGILLFRDHAVSVQAGAADSRVSDAQSSLSLIFSFVSCEHSVTSVFLTFKTTEAVEINMFSQTFMAEKVIGNLSLDVISAEISEHHYRRVRERLKAALGAKKQALIMRLGGGGHE